MTILAHEFAGWHPEGQNITVRNPSGKIAHVGKVLLAGTGEYVYCENVTRAWALHRLKNDSRQYWGINTLVLKFLIDHGIRNVLYYQKPRDEHNKPLKGPGVIWRATTRSFSENGVLGYRHDWGKNINLELSYWQHLGGECPFGYLDGSPRDIELRVGSGGAAKRTKRAKASPAETGQLALFTDV